MARLVQPHAPPDGETSPHAPSAVSHYTISTCHAHLIPTIPPPIPPFTVLLYYMPHRILNSVYIIINISYLKKAQPWKRNVDSFIVYQ